MQTSLVLTDFQLRDSEVKIKIWSVEFVASSLTSLTCHGALSPFFSRVKKYGKADLLAGLQKIFYSSYIG